MLSTAMYRPNTFRNYAVSAEDVDGERQDYIINRLQIFPAVPGNLIDPPEPEYVEFDYVYLASDKLCRRVTDKAIVDEIYAKLLTRDCA